MPKSITPEIVLAVSSGDNEALAVVAQHFHSYIAKLSTRPFYDEYGNRYDFVDDEIRKHIESKLLFKIVYDFNPYRVPEGEELPKE